MKNIQTAIVLFALMATSLILAYDDRTRIWHDDMVPNSWSSFDDGWHASMPDDRQAHIKAQREKEYRERKAKKEYLERQKRMQQENVYRK